MSIQLVTKAAEVRKSLSERIPVNSVWKWRNANQFPVRVRFTTNDVDSSGYPAMVTFETIKGDLLTLPARDFESSLANTGFSASKFTALKKTLADLA